MAQEKSPEPKKKEATVKEAKDTEVSYYEAVGRRKYATSRVRLYVTKDENLTVQGKEVAKGNFWSTAVRLKSIFRARP